MTTKRSASNGLSPSSQPNPAIFKSKNLWSEGEHRKLDKDFLELMGPLEIVSAPVILSVFLQSAPLLNRALSFEYCGELLQTHPELEGLLPDCCEKSSFQALRMLCTCPTSRILEVFRVNITFFRHSTIYTLNPH